MERYELATLTVTLGSTTKAGDNVAEFCKSGEAGGAFLGCWVTEIGKLNQIFVLRGFQTAGEADAERRRTLLHSNPFHSADIMTGLSLETMIPFPDLPPVEPGAFGPIYEFRTYVLKHGGIAPTLEGWAEKLPARTAMSKLLLAMYPVDGSPRITHIWPWASLEERARIRAESVKVGAWPPKSAVWVSPDMTSTIALPHGVSPLT